MKAETLEILIGKYLDGEITPSEQRLLEARLESNAQAKELFEQLQALHEQSREAVGSGIIEQGRTAEQIISRALQQHTKHSSLRTIKAGGWLRFAAGLAAGLLIGLALHFILSAPAGPAKESAPQTATAHDTDKSTDVTDQITAALLSDKMQKVRNVDWYTFTGKDGDKWLIEGYRESIVRPVAYNGRL
jgi:hypothetical protein